MSAYDELLAKTTDSLDAELNEDYVGIWEIFWHLRRGQDEWTNEQLWAAAEEILRRLVARGAVFGQFEDDVPGLAHWPDQEGAVARAVREWRAMDRDPTIDEVAWLERPLDG